MKNLGRYVYSCTNAMFNYLKDSDSDKLISELKRIENHAQENLGVTKKSLWFKFGINDTLCTSISDIANDTMLPIGNANREFLIERFEGVIGLCPVAELRVYYS